MLSCKEISQLASDNFAHQLPLLKRMQFKMHLMMCNNCRLFVEQMRCTIETISRLTPVQPEEADIATQVAKLKAISETSQKFAD